MQNMLTSFVDKILSLGPIRTIDRFEEQYTAQTLHRIKPPSQMEPEMRQFKTLKGIVEYASDLGTKDLFISVLSPTEVNLFGRIDPANDNLQFHYANATMPLKNFGFNAWHPLEDFIIELLSMFDETGDRDDIVTTLSALANEHVATVSDNKATQTLQIKTGLTTKANTDVKNPVVLKPYRTFREVAQPESDFILRYRNQGSEIRAALFEADGGAWQLSAIANIKAWLVQMIDIPVIG